MHNQHFSHSNVPRLLSYATSIGATIPVRVIASKGNASNAYDSLMTWLEALEGHEHLYAATERAKGAIGMLMGRLMAPRELNDHGSLRVPKTE